jgi:hypothetical protein
VADTSIRLFAWRDHARCLAKSVIEKAIHHRFRIGGNVGMGWHCISWLLFFHDQHCRVFLCGVIRVASAIAVLRVSNWPQSQVQPWGRRFSHYWLESVDLRHAYLSATSKNPYFLQFTFFTYFFMPSTLDIRRVNDF